MRATARGGRASIAESSALTVPSSAFTGLPSPSTIAFGRAKYARYSSHGTSAISSGAAGTPGAYVPVYGGVVPPPSPALGALPAVVPPSGPAGSAGGEVAVGEPLPGEVGSVGGVLPDGGVASGATPAGCV